MTTGRAARAFALVATSLGYAVVQLDVSVVNVAVAPIRADLGGPVSGVQWVVDAYTVVFAALILSAGALGDRLGAKRLFMAGFALFTAASVACGLAPSLGALIAFRAVQGVGAAALVPSSLSVLNHAYPQPAERARAIGLWAAGSSVALAGGPLVGGVLIAALSWRWIFLINLPLGLLGLVLTLRYAADTTSTRERPLDLPGQLLGVVVLAATAAATIEGGRRGFADAAVLAGFAIALVAAFAFVATERHRAAPMLPMSLFRVRNFSVAAAMGLALNISFYGMLFVLSLYFQDARHYSALQTGLAFAPATGVLLVLNVSAGRLIARFGVRTVVAGGAGLLAAGFAGLLVAGYSTPYWALVLQLLALGVGLGPVIPAITSAQLGSVDRSRSGIAAGTLNTARQTGSVVGVALFGAFAAGAGGVVAGLHRSLVVAAVLAVATLLLGLLLVPDG